MAMFSSRRRERLRRAFRRKFDTGEAQLHVAQDLTSLAVGWPVFEALHNRRRESQGQPGCFASPRFAAFHHEVAPLLLASDQLRLLWLELNGCPAAAEYGLCDEQTVYCYQTGFEPELADDSPGWLSFGASIQRAIGEGYRWFDFLRGDERYKASWKAEPRALTTIRVFARHWRGSAQHGAWSLGQRLKDKDCNGSAVQNSQHAANSIQRRAATTSIGLIRRLDPMVTGQRVRRPNVPLVAALRGWSGKPLAAGTTRISPDSASRSANQYAASHRPSCGT